MGSQGNGHTELRFFFVDAEPPPEAAGGPAPRRGAGPRLAAARRALREAQQAEHAERMRVSRARTDELTATHAALLQARQAQTQAALAAVEELTRRAAWLRHAIALGEEALARHRQFLEKLRRELAEVGD